MIHQSVFFDVSREFFQITLGNLASPDYHDSPSQAFKCMTCSRVSFDVLRKFLLPEFRIGLRRCCVSATLMPMPETAMYENGDPISRKHQVRFSRQFGMKSVAKPSPVKKSPHRQFRPGILATNPRHHAAPGCGVDNVHRSCSQDNRSGSCRGCSAAANVAILGFMTRASSFITGTTTLLPNCL